jgi:hypothetical protein
LKFVFVECKKTLGKRASLSSVGKEASLPNVFLLSVFYLALGTAKSFFVERPKKKHSTNHLTLGIELIFW